MNDLKNEDIIELAKSINTAMDATTKPLHATIEKLKADLESEYKKNLQYKLNNRDKQIDQLQAENERMKAYLAKLWDGDGNIEFDELEKALKG